jgi:Bacterial protein of unknown function (DUF922)
MRVMWKLPVITLLALTSSRSAAQSDQSPAEGVARIEWAEDRKLVIDDFRATAPSRLQGNGQPGALSFLRIEAAMTCRDGRIEGTARAVFIPGQSWWLGAHTRMWERVGDSKSWLGASRRDLEMKTAIKDANEELLRHEQLHFDMAELAARRIRQRLEASSGACVGGVTDVLSRFVGEVTRDFRQEQGTYDQQTKHGTFLSAQARWASRVKAALTK